MQRVRVNLEPEAFPEAFRQLLTGAALYDSSCSPQARVWFVDRDGGYYLKRSAPGSLEREAAMGRFFHGKGLGPEVLALERGEYDWLLTARVPGEDCLAPEYMAQPQRLCDLTAELLRGLHEESIGGCPVPDQTEDALAQAWRNFETGNFDKSHFPDNWGYATPEEAWEVLSGQGSCLKTDTLIHGDYCLPNILLDNWRFSGFIDLDTAGVGDRHMDLFWGIWSLEFNLKTDRFRDRFLDAYGRDQVQQELLRVVAAMEVFR